MNETWHNFIGVTQPVPSYKAGGKERTHQKRWGKHQSWQRLGSLGAYYKINPLRWRKAQRILRPLRRNPKREIRVEGSVTTRVWHEKYWPGTRLTPQKQGTVHYCYYYGVQVDKMYIIHYTSLALAWMKLPIWVGSLFDPVDLST